MPEKIGLKLGSMNTCTAMRTPDGNVATTSTKTAIWYEKTMLKEQSTKPPTVGEEATIHADAKYPLNLGLVETEEGMQQIRDILATLTNIPQGADIVLASPAMEITEGRNRLIKAVDETFHPKSIIHFPEGICSAAYILGDVEKLKTSTYSIANLGSTTFEFACVQETETILLSAHSEVSGNLVDEKIRMKLQNSIGDALITLKEIREIKENASLSSPKKFKVKGQTRDGIVYQEVCDEVIAPLNDYVNSVCDVLKREIKTIKPDIRTVALSNPIIVSGGMANTEGMPESIERVLNKKLSYPIKVITSKTKDNHIAPAIGALMLAEVLAKEEQHGAG